MQSAGIRGGPGRCRASTAFWRNLLVVEVDHPRLGDVRQVATPLRLSDGEAPLGRGPTRGEHTEAVLEELCGYTQEQVRALHDAGVFGADARSA